MNVVHPETNKVVATIWPTAFPGDTFGQKCKSAEDFVTACMTILQSEIDSESEAAFKLEVYRLASFSLGFFNGHLLEIIESRLDGKDEYSEQYERLVKQMVARAESLKIKMATQLGLPIETNLLGTK